MNKKYSITLDGKNIDLNITLVAHDKYINESKTNLPAAAKNFLSRCVDQKSKETLAPFLDMPQIPLQIVGEILEDYVPTVNIELKK